MKTLQDRIRERTYHLWSNGFGQRDGNDYWLMAEREVLAEIAAESLLASASPETAQPMIVRVPSGRWWKLKWVT